MMAEERPVLEHRLRAHYRSLPSRLPRALGEAARERALSNRTRRRFGPVAVLAAAALGLLAAGGLVGSGLVNPPPTPDASPSTPARPLSPGSVAEAVEAFWLIEPGDRVLVVDGPREQNGRPSILLQYHGDPEREIYPDSVFHWIDVETAAARLRPAQVDCPANPSVRAVAALQPFERLACFGDASLTFAPVIVREFRVGAWSATWLSDDGTVDFTTALPFAVAAGTEPLEGTAWFSVTGRFGDRTSPFCVANRGDEIAAARCGQRFIVTGAAATEPPPSVLGGEWRTLAEAPIGGRTDHAMVWTGSEVLVWGGTQSTPEVTVFDDAMPSTGAAYDPSADRWRDIPAAPIKGRDLPVAAWTGEELIVWGGIGRAGEEVAWLSDGAAYDPVSDRWRPLPPSPAHGPDTVGAWLDGRFVVVTSLAAAAYDPATDAWETLPPAPLREGWRSAAVAAGQLVVLAFGDGSSGTVEAAVLEPGTGAWRAVETPFAPLDAGVQPFGTDHEVLFPSLGHALDPQTGGWRTFGRCEGAASAGRWTGHILLGIGAAYDPGAGDCRGLPPAPPRDEPFQGTNGREFAVAVWTGTELITWSGATGGDTVWVPNDGAAFRPEAP